MSTLVRKEFSRKLLAFLIDTGYTHIYSLGIKPKPGESEEGEEYVLVPLKPMDPRLKYQETDMHIDEINCSEVIEMADGDEFISFFVEMPLEEADLFYLKSKQ